VVSEELLRHTLWFIANSCAEHVQVFHVILKTSCIEAMRLLSNSCCSATLKVLVWLASAFTRIDEQAKCLTLQQVSSLFEIASKANMSLDDTMVADSLHCMSHSLSSGDDVYIRELVNPSRVAFFVQNLSSHDLNVQIPALQCIANALQGEDPDIADRAMFEHLLEKLCTLGSE
jgi:hypothetical protein